jgi:hypothetical protein
MLTKQDAIQDEYLEVAESQMIATARMWDIICNAIMLTDENDEQMGHEQGVRVRQDS